MREELEELDHADEHLAALEARAEELERPAAPRPTGCTSVGSRPRPAGWPRAVEAELEALHIPTAPASRCALEAAARARARRGASIAVEFLFSANAGEPVAPLRRVASGGELSRVLLAIKGVLAAGDRVATYVFDEVDAGVGGAVAEAIGQRLRGAATGHQVLCITHLPQIAAFADAHFRVEQAHPGRPHDHPRGPARGATSGSRSWRACSAASG